MDDPFPPQIFFYELPEKEQQVAAAITNNLRSLDTYRRTFKDDLELFDFSYGNMKSGDDNRSLMGLRWMFIAARDGAMMLYHFGATLRSFHGLLQRTPVLTKLVDTKGVERAKQLFEGHFKEFEQVRHGVAHDGDHSAVPERRERHSLKESDKYVQISGPRRDDDTIDTQGMSVFARNNLNGRTYWGTVEGKSVEYDLAQESLDKLREVEEVIFGAFQKARDATFQMHMERVEAEKG